MFILSSESNFFFKEVIVQGCSIGEWDLKKFAKTLQDCCNLNGKKFFAPPEAKLMKYKIIVTTLFNAVR